MKLFPKFTHVRFDNSNGAIVEPWGPVYVNSDNVVAIETIKHDGRDICCLQFVNGDSYMLEEPIEEVVQRLSADHYSLHPH